MVIFDACQSLTSSEPRGSNLDLDTSPGDALIEDCTCSTGKRNACASVLRLGIFVAFFSLSEALLRPDLLDVW
jgi:hypothetical protein